MDQIFKVILPYRQFVKFEMKDGASEEAEKLRINCNSIVVHNPPNGATPLIFSTFTQLRQYLREIYPLISPN